MNKELHTKGANVKLNVEITNLSNFLESAKEVVKKAEELESAVQRLNGIDLSVKVNEEDIHSGNISTSSIETGQLSNLHPKHFL